MAPKRSGNGRHSEPGGYQHPGMAQGKGDPVSSNHLNSAMSYTVGVQPNIGIRKDFPHVYDPPVLVREQPSMDARSQLKRAWRAEVGGVRTVQGADNVKNE